MWTPVQLLKKEYSISINKFIVSYSAINQSEQMAIQLYYSDDPTEEQILNDVTNYIIGLNNRLQEQQ